MTDRVTLDTGEHDQQTLTGETTRLIRDRPDTFTFCATCGEYVLRSSVRRGDHPDDHDTLLTNPYATEIDERTHRRRRWYSLANVDEQTHLLADHEDTTVTRDSEPWDR